MKKLLIASLLVALSAPAIAADYSKDQVFGDWEYYALEDGIATLSLGTGRAYLANTYTDTEFNMNIGFRTLDETCAGWAEPNRTPDGYVNGVAVRMAVQCIDKGVRQHYPTTRAGTEFILNEFKQKNLVKVDNIVFSADGFVAANKFFSAKPKAL